MGFLKYGVEVKAMLKKTMVVLAGVVFAAALVVPARANAQVAVGVGAGGIRLGVGVGPVVPRPYGYVAVPAVPYVVAPAPYVAVVPPRYVYPGPVFVGGRWYPRPYAYRWHPVPRPYWR